MRKTYKIVSTENLIVYIFTTGGYFVAVCCVFREKVFPAIYRCGQEHCLWAENVHRNGDYHG